MGDALDYLTFNATHTGPGLNNNKKRKGERTRSDLSFFNGLSNQTSGIPLVSTITPLTIPNHPVLKKSTLRTILTQSRISGEAFLDAFDS